MGREERLIEGWRWVREAWDEDTAQEVVLTVLTRTVKDPVAYMKAMARFVYLSLNYPHRQRVDGKQVRVRDINLASCQMGQDPERLLLAKEEIITRWSEAQTRINGGPRQAECHSDRKNFGGGWCSVCYYEHHPRTDSRATQDRRNARKRANRRVT